MTALADFQAAGFTLRLAPDARLLVEYPGEPPADLIAELRAHRDEVVAELRHQTAGVLCLDCQTPIPESDLLCFACHERRQAAHLAPVADLLAARRARTAARLAGQVCPDCGTQAWTITRRGDAYCGKCYPGGAAS